MAHIGDTVPDGRSDPGLGPEEREHVLVTATQLLADHGPLRVTFKWVAKAADTPVELVSAEWPTMDVLVAAVLGRLAGQIGGLGGDSGTPAELLGEGEPIDLYQRIVARSLLDGLNPASLLGDFPHASRWVPVLQEQLGLDEHTVRQRLCEIVALAWGWRLFGPHLKIACGLPDEPDETFTRDIQTLAAHIVRLPPGGL
jgi:TetR/AcrR family transcriptional regulator, repressor for neighboring sulfatase